MWGGAASPACGNKTTENLCNISAALGGANLNPQVLADGLAMGGVNLNLSDVSGLFNGSINNEMSLSDLPQDLTNALSISDMAPPHVQAQVAGEHNFVCNFTEALNQDPSSRIHPLNNTNAVPAQHASYEPLSPRAFATSIPVGAHGLPLERTMSSDRNDSANLADKPQYSEGGSELGGDGADTTRVTTGGVTTRAQARSSSYSPALSRGDTFDSNRRGPLLARSGSGSGSSGSRGSGQARRRCCRGASSLPHLFLCLLRERFRLDDLCAVAGFILMRSQRTALCCYTTFT